MMTGLLFTVVAYLCGAIPWGLLVARWGRGIDIREHGSRNIGATNVWRTLGWKFGLTVFLLDFAKGALPAWGLPLLGRAFGVADLSALGVACGAATILGHMFPIWLGFKGGKGVATAVGVVVVLAPIAAALSAVAWVIVFAMGRMVSLASVLAAVLFAIVQLGWVLPVSQWLAAWPMALFSVAVPALILVRHRTNIVRILRGEEHRFGRPKVADVPSEST